MTRKFKINKFKKEYCDKMLKKNMLIIFFKIVVQIKHKNSCQRQPSSVTLIFQRHVDMFYVIMIQPKLPLAITLQLPK